METDLGFSPRHPLPQCSVLGLNTRMDEFLGRYRTIIDTTPKYGGFGRVHECLDMRSGERVAVKETELNTPIRSLTFERESKSLLRLSHPNIVPMIEYGVESGRGLVVMPWFPTDLDQYLSEDGKSLSPFQRFELLITPLINALAFAHESGVDHRDVKPNNVRINLDGVPLLSDWGSAKVYGFGEYAETVLRFESGVYTPGIPGSPMQHDVYSFGMLAIKIGSGTTPIDRDHAIEILKDSDGRFTFSSEMIEILSKALELDPVRRWANAVEFKAALEKRSRAINEKKSSKEFLAWLTLSRKAETELRSSLRISTSVTIYLNEEISKSTLFAIPVAKQEGGYKRSEFTLVSDQLKIYLAANETKDGWTIRNVIRRETEELEYLRDQGLPLTNSGIPWIVNNSIVGKQKLAKAGYINISTLINEWIDRGLSAAEDVDGGNPQVRNMVTSWERLMDAKEEIYTTRFGPLAYSKIENVNRQVSIILNEATEFELVDTSWKIPFERQESAVVTYHNGDEVQLLLRNAPNGKPKREGTITPDLDGGDAVSLQRQRTALNSLVERTSYQVNLGQYLSDPEKIPHGIRSHVSNWKLQLDESKRVAVEKSLGSPNFSLIQGPPGTGKTNFIAEYIYQELLRKPNAQILLVSQTHVALDNALERITKKVGILDVVRLGRIDDPRISQDSEKLLIDKQLQIWKRTLQESSSEFAKKLAREQGINYDETQVLIKLNQLESVLLELSEIPDASQNILTGNENDEVDSVITSVRQLKERREELVNLRTQLELELSPLVTSIGLTFPKNIDIPSINHFQGAIRGNLDLPAQFLKVIETQARWSNKVGSSSQITALFLRTRRVLAGTCLGFLSIPEVKDLTFDICIIDEASKATSTEALVPMTKSAKWVIVGDSKQLSASDYELSDPENAHILKKFGLSEEDVKETLFNRLENDLPPEFISSLDTQYRMCNPIGEMISDCFYEGKLENRGPEVNEKLKRLYPPVCWEDTGGVENFGLEHKAGSSYSNKDEMRLITQSLGTLKNFIEHGLYTPKETLEVLIISPYSAQIVQARTIITDLRQYPFKVEFNSVDAVQGREADIVFLSAVRNNQNNNSGFLGRSNWRRINVALSRARSSLVIVGNLNFWENTDSALSDVIQYIKQKNSDNYVIREHNAD